MGANDKSYNNATEYDIYSVFSETFRIKQQNNQCHTIVIAATRNRFDRNIFYQTSDNRTNIKIILF